MMHGERYLAVPGIEPACQRLLESGFVGIEDDRSRRLGIRPFKSTLIVGHSTPFEIAILERLV